MTAVDDADPSRSPTPSMSPGPRVALVTGAARRIGRAIALRLAREGWDVAVHYGRSEQEAETLVRDIAALGRRATALPADLAQEAEVRTLVGRAADILGPLTCLVNNASVFEQDTALGATRESWDLHLETNLRAPFVLSQDFARQVPDGQEGCILNILDQRVWNLTPYYVSYTLSKSGLWTLTRTLALALAPRIRVNGIGPGPTLKGSRQSEEEFEAQRRSVPLRRGPEPQEIADAVCFVLRARAMTGQMIALDGGEHLGWAQELDGFKPVE